MNKLRRIGAFVLAIVRLWRRNLRHGGMMGTAVSTFIFCALIVEIVFLCIPGVPRAIALTVPNIELGAGYWIHALGVSPLHALVLAIGFAVVELGVWSAIFAAVLRGWPVWREENEQEVASLGKLAVTLDFLANRADWRHREETRTHPMFQYRYPVLFFSGIFPGAFLLIGLPFAFKYQLRYFYLALLLGNSLKMAIFILGWMSPFPWYVTLALLATAAWIAKRASKRIAQRGDLF